MTRKCILLFCAAFIFVGCGKNRTTPVDLKIYGYSLGNLVDTGAQLFGGLNVKKYGSLLQGNEFIEILKMATPAIIKGNLFRAIRIINNEPLYAVFSINNFPRKPSGHLILVGKNPFSKQVSGLIANLRKHNTEYSIKLINNRTLIFATDPSVTRVCINRLKQHPKKVSLPLTRKLSDNPLEEILWGSFSLKNTPELIKNKNPMIPFPEQIALAINGADDLNMKMALKMKTARDADTLKQVMELAKIAASQNLSKLPPGQALQLKLMKTISMNKDGRTCTFSLSLTKQLIKAAVRMSRRPYRKW